MTRMIVIGAAGLVTGIVVGSRAQKAGYGIGEALLGVFIAVPVFLYWRLVTFLLREKRPKQAAVPVRVPAETRAAEYLALIRRTVVYCDDYYLVRGEDAAVMFPSFLERQFRAVVEKADSQ